MDGSGHCSCEKHHRVGARGRSGNHHDLHGSPQGRSCTCRRCPGLAMQGAKTINWSSTVGRRGDVSRGASVTEGAPRVQLAGLRGPARQHPARDRRWPSVSPTSTAHGELRAQVRGPSTRQAAATTKAHTIWNAMIDQRPRHRDHRPGGERETGRRAPCARTQCAFSGAQWRTTSPVTPPCAEGSIMLHYWP